jgi:hypothetical protein
MGTSPNCWPDRLTGEGSKSGGRIADAMPDRRNPDRIEHAMFEMVGARAAAIACGYEDANDLELAARAGAAASQSDASHPDDGAAGRGGRRGGSGVVAGRPLAAPGAGV